MRKVFHAHGTVDRAKVLGVSNYFQITNKALQRGSFADGFVKMALYKGIEPNAYQEVKAMLDSSSLLIVTGMSLGKTDSHWWDLVANWLAEQSDRLVVIHWYRPGMELGRGETRIRERNKVDALLCDAIGCGRYPSLVHRFLLTYNEPRVWAAVGAAIAGKPPEAGRRAGYGRRRGRLTGSAGGRREAR